LGSASGRAGIGVVATGLLVTPSIAGNLILFAEAQKGIRDT
jgi:hypothetical protein